MQQNDGAKRRITRAQTQDATEKDEKSTGEHGGAETIRPVHQHGDGNGEQTKENRTVIHKQLQYFLRYAVTDVKDSQPRRCKRSFEEVFWGEESGRQRLLHVLVRRVYWPGYIPEPTLIERQQAVPEMQKLSAVPRLAVNQRGACDGEALE